MMYEDFLKFLESAEFTLLRLVIYCVYALGSIVYMFVTKDGNNVDMLPLIFTVPLGFVLFPEMVHEMFNKKKE